MQDSRGSERESIESEDFYKLLVENSLVGICIIQNNRIEFANKFLLNALAYSLEELRNTDFWDLVTPGHLNIIKQNKMKKPKEKSTPARYEVQFLRKNGDIFNAELQDRRITYGGRPAVMCMVIDISERKNAINKLTSYRELTSILAHEAKTPLHSINSAAEQLQLRDGEKLEKEDLELIDLINKQAERLQGILTDFTVYTKPKELSLGLVDMNQISKEVADSLRGEISSRTITLEEDLHQNLREINADSEGIKQVIWNILLNAIQAIPQRGKITLSTKNENANVKIIVSDTGEGIPQKDLNLIFSPFYSTRKEGTGLGLSIAERIVKAHSGNIQVKSQLGKGSTFIIDLPKKS